jgi:hypothetical protein
MIIPFCVAGAHFKLSDLSAVTPVTPPAGKQATMLLMQTFTQNVRYTLDGSDPDANTGFQLKAGDPPVVIPVGAAGRMKVIEETAGAELQGQWGS